MGWHTALTSPTACLDQKTVRDNPWLGMPFIASKRIGVSSDCVTIMGARCLRQVARQRRSSILVTPAVRPFSLSSLRCAPCLITRSVAMAGHWNTMGCSPAMEPPYDVGAAAWALAGGRKRGRRCVLSE
jgi:hypothetical protein